MIVLYLKPRTVTVAPPVDETLPFKVVEVAPVLLAADDKTVGVVTQEEAV